MGSTVFVYFRSQGVTSDRIYALASYEDNSRRRAEIAVEKLTNGSVRAPFDDEIV